MSSLKIAYYSSLDKAVRWFVCALVYLFLSGIVAHLVLGIYLVVQFIYFILLNHLLKTL